MKGQYRSEEGYHMPDWTKEISKAFFSTMIGLQWGVGVIRGKEISAETVPYSATQQLTLSFYLPTTSHRLEDYFCCKIRTNRSLSSFLSLFSTSTFTFSL
ncbi:hypothetical protein ATANTOWER_003087 [Ataeniobius toweri]|uniref:Uncharacterized protein n=1 Tax=Ataeniobius toweri TaxID=208326 RepID=A0ABU7A0S9_9TELE|nr:hypothetical protein [Ataeniobius toweri]